jgi:diaminohydroxyphosphoribosylaminopyrimidine deaminase/5-amino-6-(5-phosphoribosylamino)uracil reductase
LTDSDSTDRRWLDVAARLASPALGTAGPGPTVGALVVDPDRQLMFGRGVTPPGGISHAEELALADANGLTEGRTLYVTLEPAAHYGSLSPVTDLIIEAGIGRVVCGALDPDRERSEQGLQELAQAGIEALYLPHQPSQLLNEGYASRVARGRPFVTMKIALSPDGMVGHNRADEAIPFGVEALRFIERQRAAADAVLSGAARAEIEDNDLRVHLDGLDTRGALRVLLSGARPLDIDRELFTAVTGVAITVVTTPDRPIKLRAGIEIVAIDGRNGHPDLRNVLTLLADRGINRVFVEAGARLAEAFIAGELVDRIHVIDTAGEIGRGGVPAAILGRFEDRIAAARFSEVDQRVLGEDKVRTLERDQEPKVRGSEHLQTFPLRSRDT